MVDSDSFAGSWKVFRICWAMLIASRDDSRSQLEAVS